MALFVISHVRTEIELKTNVTVVLAVYTCVCVLVSRLYIVIIVGPCHTTNCASVALASCLYFKLYTCPN